MEVTIHSNSMYLAKKTTNYSHFVSFHRRVLSRSAGLGHRLGRTASQHAGGRRSA